VKNLGKFDENLYEIKTLISLYSKYAQASPETSPELKNTQREMKAAKKQILKQIMELKRTVKKMEAEVVPKI